MKRSLFPDSVEVDHTALAYSESTKIDQILFRTLASNNTGVVAGLVVSVNGVDTTKLDVSLGSAIAPNGELSVSAGAQGLSLADNTSAVVNVVCVDYTETEVGPEPSEDGTTISNTRVDAAGVVVVRTLAQYTALTTAQKLNINIVARVTATGAAINPSLIVQSVAFVSVLAPSQPTLISGVSIKSINNSTPVGIGQLGFNASPPDASDPLVPTPRFRWKGPGESTFGVYVNTPISGDYTLVSTAGFAVTITVVAVSLPVVDVVDNITVASLYAQTVDRYTAEDFLHRQMVGSGTPSVNNPHGLTLSDLGGSQNQFVDEHQNLEHSTAIRRGSDENLLLAAVVAVPGPSPDYITLQPPIAGDIYYISGKQISTLASTSITFLTSVTSTISLYDLVVDQAGGPLRALRASHPASPNITGVAVIDMDEGQVAANINLVFDRTAQTLQWGAGPAQLLRGDGNYILYSSSNKWVKVNVGVTTDLGFGVVPASSGPTFTDTIQVFAPVSRKTTLWLGSVVWDGAGALGWHITSGDARQPTDKREFGVSGLNEIGQDVLNKLSTGATYSVAADVGGGGDFFGASGVAAAITALGANAGSIFVRSGTYDPTDLSGSNVVVHCEGGVVFDGVSTALTTGAALTISGDSNRVYGPNVANAAVGISATGDDNSVSDALFSGVTSNLSASGVRNNLLAGTGRSNAVSITANTTVADHVDIVLVDATSGAITVTLPLLTNRLRPIVVKKTDNSVNFVTIARAGSNLIDGQTSETIFQPGDARTLQPSTQWVIV